jgi:hypothetical protein
MCPQLVLFSDDARIVSILKPKFHLASNIVVVLGDGPLVTKRDKLDALWMSPMQASYFGVSTPLPKHVGQVFPMPLEKREKGLPRLLITGAVMAPDDPTTPQFAAELCAKALSEAVEKYNQDHQDKIIRIGSIPGNLCLDAAHPMLAVEALGKAFSFDSPDQAHVQKVKQFA